MLVSREAVNQTLREQGCSGRQGCLQRHGRPGSTLAELRRLLETPSAMAEGNRQRLLELSKRLAAVQALGDEYGRVALSPHAARAVEMTAATV